jgi:hypothetical protein
MLESVNAISLTSLLQLLSKHWEGMGIPPNTGEKSQFSDPGCCKDIVRRWTMY